ncbi:hypothetical protein CN481_02395 [Bacillus sp. AFS006103]|nr:hypothetical protein CN481_02395 [Bacillus sp. AFS006103]
MKTKTKVMLMGLLFAVIIIPASIFGVRYYYPNTNDFTGIKVPSAPTKTPVKNVNTDILFDEKKVDDKFYP